LSLPIYDKLKKPRYEFYEAPEKIFIDATPQGTGKTWAIHPWVLNNNHNNISFFNTHAAIDEIYQNISRFGGLNGQLNNYIPNVNVLFGKRYLLTPKQQHIYDFPPSLCPNLYKDNYLFNLRDHGFLIENYCNTCPDRHSCIYKINKETTLQAYKIKINNICMMPKSYIHTHYVDDFISNFKDLIVISEESLFNILKKEEKFFPWQIDNYIDLINSIIERSRNKRSLREIWNPLETLLFLIRNHIKGKKNLKKERKIKNIVEGIDNFINPLGKDPVSKLKEWNNHIKQSLFTYRRDMEKTRNITNGIEDILEDIIKQQKLNLPMKNFFIINERDNKLSYIINKIDRIKEIIRESKKFIINDATGIKEMYDIMLPEFEDDITFFSRDDLLIPWKRVYTLHKNWAKKATYPKYSLMVKYPKESKENFKRRFYDLINILKRCLKYEYNEGREKVLILAFKAFMKSLKEKLNPLIKKLRLQVSWEYWYNLEGKNVYSDCEYGIAFGTPGWPKQEIQVYNKMLGIPENILRWFSTEDQIIQGMGRLRAILYKYTKIWYNLTNIITNRFVNEVDLLSQITSTMSVGNLMEQLEKDGQIKSRRAKIGGTKHSLVYKYIKGE